MDWLKERSYMWDLLMSRNCQRMHPCILHRLSASHFGLLSKFSFVSKLVHLLVFHPLGNWLRRTVKRAKVACSCCHPDPGEYSINCGLWVKDTESTKAPRHPGVLRAPTSLVPEDTKSSASASSHRRHSISYNGIWGFI
jgi:hypothetical protein